MNSGARARPQSTADNMHYDCAICECVPYNSLSYIDLQSTCACATDVIRIMNLNYVQLICHILHIDPPLSYASFRMHYPPLLIPLNLGHSGVHRCKLQLPRYQYWARSCTDSIQQMSRIVWPTGVILRHDLQTAQNPFKQGEIDSFEKLAMTLTWYVK